MTILSRAFEYHLSDKGDGSTQWMKTSNSMELGDQGLELALQTGGNDPVPVPFMMEEESDDESESVGNKSGDESGQMGKDDDSAELGGGLPASLEGGIPLSAGKKHPAAGISKSPTSEKTTKGLSERRRIEENNSDEDEEEEQNHIYKPLTKKQARPVGRVSKSPTSETTTKELIKRRRIKENNSDEDEDEEEDQLQFFKPLKKRHARPGGRHSLTKMRRRN